MKSHNLQYSGAWRSIISLQGFFWTASGSCCAPLCGIVSGRRLCCPQLTLKKSHRHLKEDSCGVVGRFQEKLLHYYFKLLLSQNACSKLLKAPLQTFLNFFAHKVRCCWKGAAVFPVALTDTLHIICCNRMPSGVWIIFVESSKGASEGI